MGHNLITKLVQASKNKIQTQGEFSRDLITEVVDEVIDEFMRDGLITDDEDTAVLAVEVKNRLENEIG